MKCRELDYENNKAKFVKGNMHIDSGCKLSTDRYPICI